MNPFKKSPNSLIKAIAVLAFAIFLFTGNAAAQCGGKTVYLQLPSGWGTNIYVYWEGSFRLVTGTKSGDWTVITLPTLSNDAPGKREIVFSNKNTNYDAAGIFYITRQKIDKSPNLPSETADKFICSDFGADGTYIMEDPARPGTAAISTQPPNAFHFYFLPPNREEWIAGTPYFANAVTGSVKPMKIDQGRCGWYKMTFFDVPVPDDKSPTWIYLGPNEKFDIIGKDGADDPWEEGWPVPIDLKAKFDGLLGKDKPGSIFFVPDDGAAGWHGTDPGINQASRCFYEMAAIIYDSDQAVYGNGNDKNTLKGPFKCGIYQTCGEGPGVSPGIPDPTLGADRKMKFKGAGSDARNDGWDAASFADAFKSSPGKNVTRCYDMPFGRNKQGLWEFDSDRLCANGQMDPDGLCEGNTFKGYMGGFFPPELQTRGTGDYSQCANCDAKRMAEPWVPLRNEDKVKINKWCYDRGWLGGGTKEGDLTGLTGTAIDNEMKRVCEPLTGVTGAGTTPRRIEFGDLKNGTTPEIWDWGKRASFGTATATGTAGMPANMRCTKMGDGNRNKECLEAEANEFFCFESHSEFTYEKGQEFFFRGDDDIWIYVNNHLVIDLGGSHLAAPGFVMLDTITQPAKLVEGQKYPIDIFFCDSRTTMSNVRITTNIFFSQSSGWKINGTPEKEVSEICLTTTSSGNTCGSAGGSSKTECGATIGNKLEYYMVRQGSADTLWLDPGRNAACSWDPAGQTDKMTCHGGVVVYAGGGKVQIFKDNIPLSGTYRVYVKPKKNFETELSGAPPLLITSFSKVAGVTVVYGDVKRDDNNDLIRKLPPKEQVTVAGRLVPVGFAAATFDQGTFLVSMDAEDGSAGRQFRLDGAGFADANVGLSNLKVYKDSLGAELVRPSDLLTIPQSGLLVLWVTGDYEAEGVADYVVKNANGKEEAKIKVYLPIIRFIDPATKDNPAPTVLAAGTWRTKGSDVAKAGQNVIADSMTTYTGSPMPRVVAAFDPSSGTEVLCKDCSFTLSTDAAANNASLGVNAAIVNFNLSKLENGVAEFAFIGMKEILNPNYAHFTIGGPSKNPNTLARWDSLTFEKPVVPVPKLAEIYDRSGDGFGDEIRIAYDSDEGKWNFLNADGSCKDTLPNYIEIFWDLTLADTIGIGPPGVRKINGEYGSVSKDIACKFWKDKIEKDADGRDLVIVLKWEDFAKDYPSYKGFSKDIKTAVGPNSSKVTILSWSSFRKSASAPLLSLSSVPIDGKGLQDRIPAIVVSARYEADKSSSCGTSVSNKCEERVYINLSEPVIVAEGGASDVSIKTSFAYLLDSRGSSDFRIYDRATPQDYAESMTWGYKPMPAEVTGDSVVLFIFKNYRDQMDTTNTPVANDSVKFASIAHNPDFIPVLVDLAGNSANPNENGRVIEGENRTQTVKISIADQDPTKEVLKDAIKDVNDKYGIDIPTTYFDNTPVEILPILPGWKGGISDSIKTNYPGSVGFATMPDVKSKIGKLERENGITIPDSAITFHARAFFHTNLGNFTANKPWMEVRCDNQIFPLNKEGESKPSCRTPSNSGIYVAWDLKDNKNRWVGVGAYVGLYDFYWEVKYEDKAKNININEKFDDVERKTEMVGVRRVKSKK